MRFLSILPFYSYFVPRCKTIPGDAAWPSPAVWAAFNASVDGRLVQSVPLATPCHHPNFDAAKCAIVQNNWHSTDFHLPSSSSIMDAAFSNRSCDPFNGADSPCVLGTYVVYAVNVSTRAQISKTVLFAKAHNIRFVVRNTGHDYMGKSTGSGALAVWTHHLKETKWIPSYSSPGYTGPAVKAGPGISAEEIYQQASEHGYTVMGGACPTVGVTGGYLQGGGHGPLSSLYGLAADNVLAFEVVTTNGMFVQASPTRNADLFWALCGGGPGTYAIVWSVTLKALPDDLPFTSAVVIFSTSNDVTVDSWFEGVDAFRSIIPDITAAGGYASYMYSLGYFHLAPALIRNQTVAEVTSILQPFFASLDFLGIPYTKTITTYPGFFQAYTGSFNLSMFGVQSSQTGGRLIPKSVWSIPARLSAYNSVVRAIVNNGGIFIDLALAPTLEAAGNPTNAVLPAWRDSLVVQMLNLRWDDHGTAAEAQAQREMITTKFIPHIKAVTAGSGAYMNEADPLDPDWKATFYGVNYPKLLAIKDRWDPDQMLYGATAVGGDRWVEALDGRLCKA